MKTKISKLLLVLVAIFWGLAFIFNDLALEHASSGQILTLRFTIAALLSAVLLAKQLKSFNRTEWKWGILSGSFMFLAFYFQTIGLKQTTVSKNAFLSSLSVIIIPFFNRFVFKDRLPKATFLASFLTMIGVAFLSYDGSAWGQLNRGDMYSLLSAVFFALQIMSNARSKGKVSDAKLLVGQLTTAALLSWFFILFTGDINIELNLYSGISIAYLAVISTCLSYAIQNWSLNHVSSSTAALILASESIFASLFSVLLQGEQVTVVMILGGMFILLGIVIVEWTSHQQEKT